MPGGSLPAEFQNNQRADSQTAAHVDARGRSIGRKASETGDWLLACFLFLRRGIEENKPKLSAYTNFGSRPGDKRKMRGLEIGQT